MGFEPTTPTLARLCSVSWPASFSAEPRIISDARSRSRGLAVYSESYGRRAHFHLFLSDICRGRLLEASQGWSEWQDLNLRPPCPERGALPDCANSDRAEDEWQASPGTMPSRPSGVTFYNSPVSD